MGRRHLIVLLAAMASGCSLFVSLDGLSTNPDSSDDAGAGTDGKVTSDGGSLSDSPFTTTEGGTTVDAGNAYATAILSDSPIGYWRFEETSGTAVHDEIGGRDGTFVGGFTRGVPGIAGHAATFDGTSACVSVGGGGTFIFPNEAAFSVESWVQTPATRPPIGWVVSTELLNPDPYPRYGWSTYVDQNGYADMDGWNADIDSGAYIFGGYSFNSSGSAITPQTWTQVVGTYATNGHFTLYINGDPRDQSDSTGGLSSHAGSLSIGCRDTAHPNYLFTGSIDEVSIYDKTLTASQVLAHYRAATTP